MQEKLVELVRNNPCLYDTNDQNYKNSFLKTEICQKIATELCTDTETNKMKWKSLRYAFVRFKKQQRGTTGQPFKQFNRHWLQQMEFLSPSFVLRETSTNIYPQEIQNEAIQWNVLPQENFFYSEDYENNQEGATSDNKPSCSSSNRNEKRRKRTGQDEVEHVLVSYLTEKKSKNTKKDSADCLFESYAETFKKFIPKNQIKIKMHLAKLFADIEMEELEEQSNAAEQLVYPQNVNM